MNREEVKKLAHLARLHVSEEETDTLSADLDSILHFVEQLSSADLHQVEPLAHPLDVSQRLRFDTVAEQDRRESFQKIAPHSQDGYYLVPKVID